MPNLREEKESCFFPSNTCFLLSNFSRINVLSREEQQTIFLECCCSLDCNLLLYQEATGYLVEEV
jgi:hypothetical protein